MWRAYNTEDWANTGGPHRSPPHLQEDDNEDEEEDGISSFSCQKRFGCQTKITGFFITQLAEGIEGMDFNQTYRYLSIMREGILLDPILPRVGIMFTSPTSNASGIVLPDDPIKRLWLDPTQEPGL